jgi:hypothetical protein
VDSIRTQRLKLRGRLVLFGQRKKLDEHQEVALVALNDMKNLANLLVRILWTLEISHEQMNEISSWLESRGYPAK